MKRVAHCIIGYFLAAILLSPKILFASAGLPNGENNSALSVESISISDVVGSSFAISVEIETYRRLPESVSIGDLQVEPSGFLHMAAVAIISLAASEPAAMPSELWAMPLDPYPIIILDDQPYAEPLSSSEYLGVFESLISNYPNGVTIPGVFDTDIGAIRFVDVVYLSAQLLRHYSAFEFLPAALSLKVTSCKGLFPWEVPTGFEEFVGAIRNNEQYSYETNEYMQSSAMDFDMYKLVKDIIGAESDPYLAGELIYDWVGALYNSTPYGATIGAPLFGFPVNSHEAIRRMIGTSGTPHRPKEGLYPAAALPYGSGGALYVEGRGWFNAEIHRPYGTDLADNPFYYYDPVNPEPGSQLRIPLLADDVLLPEIKQISELDSGIPDFAAIWVNGSDVQEYGADKIVLAAREGGIHTIILTVKNFLGDYFFDYSGGFSGQVLYPALAPLIQEAKKYDVEVLAAIDVLPNFREVNVHGDWAQDFFQPVSGYVQSLYYASPCVSDYVTYLHDLLSAVVSIEDLKGIVFSGVHVFRNAWANPECGFTENSTLETKQNFLSDFANSLAQYVKDANPDLENLFLTAPRMDYEGGSIDVIDAKIISLNPEHFDGLIINVPGLSWLTSSSDYRDNILAATSSESLMPVSQAVYLSKEWQFSPQFYRGLYQSLRGKDLSGMVLVSNISMEGQLGPAFLREHYSKISKLNFELPPTFQIFKDGFEEQ